MQVGTASVDARIGHVPVASGPAAPRVIGPAAGGRGDATGEEHLRALARVVGCSDSFVRDDLGRRPRHLITTDRLRLLELLAVDDVGRLAGAEGAPAPGTSLVLQGLHDGWEPVARLRHALEATLSRGVQVDAHLVARSSPAPALRRSDHDLLVAEIDGVERWIVDPPDGTRWQLELFPGDVLYLPAGTAHAAWTTDHHSLRLVIGVRSSVTEVPDTRVARPMRPETGPRPGGPRRRSDDTGRARDDGRIRRGHRSAPTGAG